MGFYKALILKKFKCIWSLYKLACVTHIYQSSTNTNIIKHKILLIKTKKYKKVNNLNHIIQYSITTKINIQANKIWC